MKNNKYINLFNDYLKSKGYSERTLASYTYEIKRFLLFIEEHYPRIKNLKIENWIK